jgi:solute:Na+ symporter, SSS family
MSSSAIALSIIFTIVAVGSAIGFYAGTRHKMSLEQWTVGSRAFGTPLMWLLMAGEIYTAFSFLGVSGWAYSAAAQRCTLWLTWPSETSWGFSFCR